MITKAELQRQAAQLSTEERIELVLELWETIEPESRPVPDWHLEIIRERLAALEATPRSERSTPWEEVHQRVFTQEI